MKNVILLNNVEAIDTKIANAVKGYNAASMTSALRVLRAADVDYVGGVVLPQQDAIQVLFGADKEEYIAAEREAYNLGQLIGRIREERAEARYALAIEEAIEERVMKAMTMMEQAKAGDVVAVSNINGLKDMQAIITDMERGAVINWRAKGAKGSAVSNPAGTGRRSRIEYKLVNRDANGNIVFGTVAVKNNVVKLKAVKGAGAKQAKIYYKEGDKGYTAPKGVPTPAQVKSNKEKAVRPTVIKLNNEFVAPVANADERESVVISFGNLQLLASNNTNNKNTNTEGEKKMKRSERIIGKIAKGLNMKHKEVAAYINDETVIARGKEALEIIQGRLFSEDNRFVCRVVTIINDLEIDAQKQEDLKGLGCSINHEEYVMGHFHRNSGIKPHSVKRTVKIVDPKGNTKEVVAGGDAPVKYYDSILIADLSKQPNLDPEKTFGFYIHQPLGATQEHVYLIRKEAGVTRLIKDGLVELTGGEEFDQVINCNRHYTPIQSTPGGKKELKAVYINSKIYDEAAATALVDNAMGGAYEYALNKALVKAQENLASFDTLRFEDIAKLDARVSMHNTPSIDIASICGDNPGTVMYIDMPRETMMAALKEANGLDSLDMFIENTNKTTDGQADGTTEMVAFDMLRKYNVLVDPDELVGQDFQMRCDTYNAKVFLVLQDARRLRRNAKRFAKMVEELGAEYTLHGKNPSLDDVVMILDSDGAKAVNFDAIKANQEVNLVFLARAKANGVSVSNQMSSGILAAPMIEEYVGVDVKSAEIEDKMTNVLTQLSRENTLKNIEQLAMTGYNVKANSQNPFFAVNPQLAVTDRFVLNGALTGLEKNAVAAVTSGKVPTTGYTTYCLFDNAYWITGGVVRNILSVRSDLHAVEVFNKALLKDKAAEIKAIEDKYTVEEARPMLDKILLVYGVKYPAVSVFENLLGRAKTVRELKYDAEQIKAQLTSEEDKLAVDDALSFIIERGEGTIVLTPEDLIKEVWAGMDTDFDSLAVFTDSRLVELLADHKNAIDMMAVGTIIGDREAVCDMTTTLAPKTVEETTNTKSLEDLFGSSNTLNI